MGIRMAADLGFAGAAIGFAIAVAQFVGLMWLSFVIERYEWRGVFAAVCLMRIAAMLGLALGTGVGYLIGRSLGV